MAQITLTETDLRRDFKNFLRVTWQSISLPPPTPIQLRIAEYIQNGGDRLIVEGFRGVAKSWITAAYVAWTLWNDPRKQILVVSADSSLADAFTTFTQRLLRDLPFLQDLVPTPKQRDNGWRWRLTAFDVGLCTPVPSPSVRSAGITGRIVGSRADLIIFDDCESPTNAVTHDQREKLLHSMLEGESILKPGGRILLLGTPHTRESVYVEFEKRGYAPRIWPAEVPERAKLDNYRGLLCPFIEEMVLTGVPAGTPTEPTRFPSPVLDARRNAMGKSRYALQFMLDTSPSDANRFPLKTGDLVVTPLSSDKAPGLVVWGGSKEQRIDTLQRIGYGGDAWYKPAFTDKDWRAYEDGVMAIDPSGRGEDETTAAVVKYLHGYLFVLDVSGWKGGYGSETLTSILHLARDHAIKKIIVEPNFGDGMFTELLKQHAAKLKLTFDISETERSTTQKERRIIDTLEPLFNRHRVIVDEAFVGRDLAPVVSGEKDAETGVPRSVFSLFHQLVNLTGEKGALRHDDKADVLALACRYFVEAVNRDETQAKHETDLAMLAEDFRLFIDGHAGRVCLLKEAEPTPAVSWAMS